MIEGVLASGAVAPLALLVMLDVALLASTTHLRSRLPVATTGGGGGEQAAARAGTWSGGPARV